MDNLRLRNFHEDDFEAFHALCSDYDVVKMVSSWPYPADVEFSRMRMNTPEAKAGLVSVVECDGQFAGNIGGIQGGLGYMLAKPFWGRGIATWAVREKLRECFINHNWDKIEAGAWNDNPASVAVLKKNGFEKTGDITQYCKARDCDVEGQDFELTRAKWVLSQPLHIETDRLIIRPFEQNDGEELAALMNDRDIARMMASIPHPFSVEQATQWIADRPFDRSTGFGAKIILKDGTLIGLLGLGGNPVNTAYALGRKYWGKGYATEAMRAFLADSIAIHALEEVTAGAFIDNPASQKVLEKLGFERDGQKMHKAPGRVEETPLFLYRLRSAKFGTS